MKVTLLSHTPEPEKMIAAAAKLCYSSAGIDELTDSLSPEKVEAFLDRLSEMGHESPIEHASFTFGIEGVSRALLAQITRHRIASFSVQSQRYVRETQFQYVTPPEIALVPEAEAEFHLAMRRAEESYEKISLLLKEKHIETLCAQGLEEKEARRQAEKSAIEDARFILPNACETKMIVTMNARSLYNFFALRCCNRAQWEIRCVADEMLSLVSVVAPALFAKAGPRCCASGCAEGQKSCKKAGEMRAHIAALKKIPATGVQATQTTL